MSWFIHMKKLMCIAFSFTLVIFTYELYLVLTVQRCPDQIFTTNSKTLLDATMKLQRAYQFAQSPQTKFLIKEVLQVLDRLGNTDQPLASASTPTLPKTYELPEVCPEKWAGFQDVVYFNTNYQTVECERQPLDSLVHLVLLSDSCKQANNLISRIRQVYPTLQITMGILSDSTTNLNCDPMPLVSFFYKCKDDGLTWLRLVRSVKTKYVLIGRNMVDFTAHTDIDRLLRVHNELQVDVVGGAVRLEPEGRWYQGCYQVGIRNYTIRLRPGHHLSKQSCAYCDYIASPFLIRTKLFLKHMQRNHWQGPIPFVDMFMHTSQKTDRLLAVTCVDVLFHVAGHDHKRGLGIADTNRSYWTELARTWLIEKVQLPGGTEHRWTCAELDIKCERFQKPGITLPPCCLQELANGIKAFVKLANEKNVTVCLFSGNTVGAIKMFGGILPWERDSDIGWDAEKNAILRGYIKSQLELDPNYRLGPVKYYTIYKDDVDKCRQVANTSCMYYSFHTPNWRIQLYGEPILPSRHLLGPLNPTLVYVDGMWIETYPNPGKVVRNQYGDNILGHMEHWSTFGESTGWSNYTLTEDPHFLPCPELLPLHSCLSANYLPTGNIQFTENFV